MNLEEARQIFLDTELFYHLPSCEYEDFCVLYLFGNVEYVLEINYIEWTDAITYQWYKEQKLTGYHVPISFEEVLDNVSSELQEHFIFHLDLLRRTP